MGETETHIDVEQDEFIRPTFNRSIRVEARPERLSADAGVLMMREVMERTGLIDWIDAGFDDLRRANQVTHSLPELLRTQLILLAQGWTCADDADHCETIRRFGCASAIVDRMCRVRPPSTPHTATDWPANRRCRACWPPPPSRAIWRC